MSRWKCVPLAKLAHITGGGTPTKSEAAFWNGDIPWVSPKDMWVDEVVTAEDKITSDAVIASATQVIPAESLLCVVRSGILARKFPVAITRREVAINQDIKAIIPKKDLHARYLFYFLKASEPLILAGVTTGATVHRISTDALKELEVPLPPLEEQRRIVAVLDEAFAAIATATANAKKSLANAREAFLAERECALSEARAGWKNQKLGGLCIIKHGFAFKSEYFTGAGDYVLLTPGNFFEAGGYRDRGSKQKYYDGPIPPGFLLKAGSLLVAMTEQAAGLLGSPIIVPSEGQFLHNQRLGLVEPRAGVEWDNGFFFHVFNTQKVRDELHKTGTGVKVRHTSPEKIGRLHVPVPSTLAEQRLVASRLNLLSDELCRLVEIQERKLSKLEELRESILLQAFSAKLAPEVRIAA